MVDNSNRQKLRNKAKDERKKQSVGFSVGDLVIPLLSIIILMLLVFFVYIPLLNEASEVRTQIDETKQKIEQMDILIKSVKSVDDNELSSDYKLISSMIPARLEVASFALYIDELAVSKSLTLESITASNSKPSGSEELIALDTLYSVNGPLRYSGSYNNVVDFLSEMNEYSPYIISLGAIKMSGGENADLATATTTNSVWNLELSVTGYYMEDATSTNAVVDIYKPFWFYGSDTETIQLLRKRGEKLSD